MKWFWRKQKALSQVGGWRDGWRIISEPFAGAWQRNQSEVVGDVLTYPTLYACIMRIAKDIGKLPFRVMRQENGIWVDASLPEVADVLAAPNQYQTPQQFREAWQLSKLTQGNAYVLKSFDGAGRVDGLYPLDPTRVMPLVSDSGAVFYRLNSSDSERLDPADPQSTLPARFVIHDREITLHHPLIGVPPLAAASWPAVKNLRILRSNAEFFANNAQPGGILVAPGQISNETADRIKRYWEEKFSGNNSGRIAVLGDDLKFVSLAAKSIDSQMVEQLRYSDTQICQPFGMPAFKVGIGDAPAGYKPDDINVQYHADALSDRIEHMETLLSRGLGVEEPFRIEMDLDPLWRMDEGKRAEVETKLVGKIKMPDESRRRLNLPPTPGGDTLWGQHQDYPLGVLAERDDLKPVSPPPVNDDNRRAMRAVRRAVGVIDGI